MRTVFRFLFTSSVALSMLTAGLASAQSNAPVTLQVGAPDFAASATPATRPVPGAQIPGRGSSSTLPGAETADFGSEQGDQRRIFYPEDVSNPGHGATLQNAQHHPIYVDQAPNERWGQIQDFLQNLGKSEFIHVLDQYTGNYGKDRYTLGGAFAATIDVPADNTFRPAQIYALVHAAAAIGGSGYGHLYHVFLPQGASVCYLGQCYTPNDPSSVQFCALHDSVTFDDSVGHVVFTLEPYLDSSVCSVLPGTPNGQLADTTYSFLSHEIFEAITDPDGDAWWIHDFTFAYGSEMADNCQRRPHGSVPLNGKLYNVQPEYSNQLHGCVYGTDRDGDGDR